MEYSALNRIDNLERFIRNWETQRPARPQPNRDRVRDVDGHINDLGLPSCLVATQLTPWDSHFVEALEPGIRELVLLCVEVLDCITYASCEGHRSFEGSKFRRRIGILPRSVEEYWRLMGVLLDAAARANVEVMETTATRVTVNDGLLQSGTKTYLCIDVTFLELQGDEVVYLSEVGVVYDHFLQWLRHGASKQFKDSKRASPNRTPTSAPKLEGFECSPG